MVHWIDSKATFGDEFTFSQSQDQLLSYVNRFGSGMVIYWFDFVDSLADKESSILFTSRFPRNIMW